MARERQLQDSISFRLPGALGQRLRDEAEQSHRGIGEVMRKYLVAGVQTLDASEAAAGSPDSRPAA